MTRKCSLLATLLLLAPITSLAQGEGDLPIQRRDRFFKVQKGCHAQSLGR